jgi:hypothetical protein
MALMDVFTHFSIVRRERRGIRPEEIKEKRSYDFWRKINSAILKSHHKER